MLQTVIFNIDFDEVSQRSADIQNGAIETKMDIQNGKTENGAVENDSSTGYNSSEGSGDIVFPKPPKPASLSDTEARRWYLDSEAKIPDLIDKTKPLEQQARQAFELRNMFRTEARIAMNNRVSAKALEITEPNQTWEQIVEKYVGKGFTGDALYEEIVKASTRSRTSINEYLGIYPK